jgi:hypothetical protein
MARTLENVVFLKIDVDEAEDAAQEYNVSAMPTFIFIKNNAKVKTLWCNLGSNVINFCFVHTVDCRCTVFETPE